MFENLAPVLQVNRLNTRFKTRSGDVHAVNTVSFDLKPGELLGVVGESGSGKSVTMMSLLGLLPSPPAMVSGDSVMFEGVDLLHCTPEQLRSIRGARIGFIFQDPTTSLNPVFTVGFQIMEPLRKHMGMGKEAARKRAQELLELVGIPDAGARLKDYPHQFSGGMRQRVMIAIALACDPKVLIADEPTTALDVTIQAQILELIRELRGIGFSNAIRRPKKGPEKAPGRARRGPKYASLGGFSAQSGRLQARGWRVGRSLNVHGAQDWPGLKVDPDVGQGLPTQRAAPPRLQGSRSPWR
jgi:ABC-type glutathione transport system ATPase component